MSAPEAHCFLHSTLCACVVVTHCMGWARCWGRGGTGLRGYGVQLKNLWSGMSEDEQRVWHAELVQEFHCKGATCH